MKVQGRKWQLALLASIAQASTVQAHDGPQAHDAMVAVGSNHTLVVDANGTVWAWGDNSYGQLGDGTTTASYTPVRVDDISNVIAVAAGSNHSVALTSDGQVYTWGTNSNGELGNGTYEGSNSPVLVDDISGIAAIAAGSNHTLALSNGGAVYAWGYNGNGEVGDDTFSNQTSPAYVLSSASAIAAGSNHSVAIVDEMVYAWGYNSDGELGLDDSDNRGAPVLNENYSGFIAIAAGGWHTVALADNGTVWTWGYNGEGQLGNGSYDSQYTPVEADIGGVELLGAGYRHTLAISGSSLYGWGYNSNGELGNSDYSSTVTPVEIMGDVMAVGRGNYYAYRTVVVRNDGTVWASGDNENGEIGNGDTSYPYSFVQVVGAEGRGYLNLIHPVETYTVSTVAVKNGSIDDSRDVNAGETASFEVYPSDGYTINTVKGCNGYLDGTTYYTGEIYEDCTVSATFKLRYYTVTASVDGEGTITPATRSVRYNATTTFTVKANTGYAVDRVEGCDGTLSSNGRTYVTGKVTSDCEVVASFVSNEAFPPQAALPDMWKAPSGSSAAWYMTDDWASEGYYSLRSGEVGHSKKSQIQVRRNFQSGTVSFTVRVSSEEGYDGLVFSIDNVVKGVWSGEVGATTVSFPVKAYGYHTFLWSYIKDASDTNGEDAAWIDNVSLPYEQ